MTDSARPAHRIIAIDLLRGCGIALMFVYHFSWDLTFFRFAEIPLFTDPGWLAFRTVIVGIFLGTAGISHVLSHGEGLRIRPLLHRLAVVAGAAALITGATALVFPDGFIFFGILHHLAAAAILAIPFVMLPSWVSGIVAIGIIAAPAFLAHPVFDAPLLLWIGLLTGTTNSVDYVPIFPWFGIVLFGVIVGRWLAHNGTRAEAVSKWQPQGRAVVAVRWLGRNSLALYIIHQPVFFVLLYGASCVRAVLAEVA
jgi:uncharacterized membrane protein